MLRQRVLDGNHQERKIDFLLEFLQVKVVVSRPFWVTKAGHTDRQHWSSMVFEWVPWSMVAAIVLHSCLLLVSAIMLQFDLLKT